MQILRTTKVRLLAALLVVGITGPQAPTVAQTSQGSEPLPLSEPVPPSQPSASGDQVFAELVKHNELRSTGLREYSAVRTYVVTDLNGKVHAKETVQMEYIAPDKKTFVTIAAEGSVVIRNLVLKRLMESEMSAAAGKEHHDSSITPANYTFRILNEDDLDSHHCFVVEAVPKRNDKYLFEGKIWIDSSEFAIVKISGHPAKKLSFWITRADFVRRYEKIGDFWLPVSDETFVEVRLYGKKIFSIQHHIKSVNGVTSTALVGQNPHEVESATHGTTNFSMTVTNHLSIQLFGRQTPGNSGRATDDRSMRTARTLFYVPALFLASVLPRQELALASFAASLKVSRVKFRTGALSG